MTTADRPPARHHLLRFASLFRQSRGLLMLSGAGLLLGTGLSLVGPWVVAQAIDVHLVANAPDGLLQKALLYLLLIAASFLVTYAARTGVEIAAQRAMLSLKEALFDHLLDHDLALHDKQTSGRLITRIQGDIEALRTLFTEVILNSPADLALFIGIFTVMTMTAPAMTPYIAAVLPVWVVLFVVFRWVAPPRFLALRKVHARLTGFFTEHIRAMPTIQSFAQSSWARQRAEDLNARVFHAEVASSLIPVGYFNSLFLARNLSTVLILWIGAGLIEDGVLTIGILVMALGYLRQMFGPLMRLSHHQATIERARAAAIRIAELMDTPRQICDPPEPVPWPGLHRSLRLEGVSFHYVEDAPILHELSLEIPAGASVGIVGSTGAGKSTVLNLLLRFRDPVSGRITVDGTDLRDIALQDLRRRTGLVLQDVQLFPGTILENLGGDAVAAQAALDTLQIGLPLDRLVGGSQLSRGQRQLLTFARALVGNPEVLVLDEATSAIDPATEFKVQAALATLQQGRTTIMVAHRLATVRRCDIIYVLHRGQLLEQGSHSELIATGGMYASLARLQEVA